jgi:hypothetical protein
LEFDSLEFIWYLEFAIWDLQSFNAHQFNTPKTGANVLSLTAMGLRGAGCGLWGAGDELRPRKSQAPKDKFQTNPNNQNSKFETTAFDKLRPRACRGEFVA